MAELEEEEFYAAPPTQQRVAQRAIILTILAYRGRLESQPHDSAASDSWTKVKAWFDSLGIEAELEQEETQIIASPLGGLTLQQAINSSWRIEGAGVLAWALKCYQLPKLDETCNLNQLGKGLNVLHPLETTALYTGKIRSAEELERYGSIALTVHWRLRQFSLQPEAIDFKDFVRGAQWGPLSLEGINLAKKDLAIHTVPISKADKRVVTQVESIARERHQAINWLMGWHELYSEVDTSI